MSNRHGRNGMKNQAIAFWRRAGIRASLVVGLITLSQLFLSCVPAPPAVILARVAETQRAAQSKADCVSSVKRGSMGVKDREFLPAYWTRAVQQGSAGYHCWTVDNYSPYGLHWSSDTLNIMNDFIVFGYNVGATRQLTLELKGGWMSFSNKSEQGPALMLGVFQGSPPASLFKDKEIDLKKFRPLNLPKTWYKPQDNNAKIDPVSIPLQVGGSSLSVVLVGVDSWSSTSVRIDIVGLRLLSRTPLPRPPMKKK